VAAGGGGGGFKNFPGFGPTTCAGGPGGAAETKGANGTSCGFTGGEGGGAGEQSNGGAGGSGYAETTPSLLSSGRPGKLGAGGGLLFDDAGGGGGGLYGGGEGGEQADEEPPKSGGQGGGGGGSNLVPTGGSHALAAAGQAASVKLTWTAPTLPDLSLKNKASPSPVVSGNTLTYTLTVTNTGGETANKVTLEDLLPESAVFGSVSTTQGTCNRKIPPTNPKTKDGAVLCKLGSLEGGKTATITIEVTPTKPGTLEAKAIVKASNVTSDANDEETATTTVLGD
jgi:uncharacterized repeat protein (TIGR01451 family)